MAISFGLTKNSLVSQAHFREMAEQQMRPISRRYDDREHELPTEWVDYYWKHGRAGPKNADLSSPGDGFVQVCVQAEELCWGDAGLYLRMPTAALGGSAVAAASSETDRMIAILGNGETRRPAHRHSRRRLRDR